IIVVAVAAAALAIIFILHRPLSGGKAAKKAAASVRGESPKTIVPAKKTFQKGMGGLTVSIKNAANKPQYLRIKAFNADGKKTSIFVAAFGAERMKELPAGRYDIELDTVPAQIYKGIEVKEGKETVEDLGPITGSLTVKALNSKKKEASVSVKIINAKSDIMVAVIAANRPAEIVPGVYNADIETLPRQTIKDIRVDGGKETVVDLGVVYGTLTVKALDDNGKEARLGVRIKNPASSAIVASTITNRLFEISPGEYDVEVLSAPVQTKKGVKVNAAEDTTAEFSISAMSQPAPAQRIPAPAKKR
ncbi:MAG: hypothetical protein PHN63_06690, partial [Candidatus Omnitrophica bacterium]|nr:hypothetical protein [Candidatus Omnitrophota bacterium]